MTLDLRTKTNGIHRPKGRTRSPFRSILVPLDGSPHAERALAPAAAIAAALGAELKLLRVVRPVSYPGFECLAYARAGVKDPFAARPLAEARDYLLGVMRRRRGLPARTSARVVVDGWSSAADAILAHARSAGVDLIVLAPRKRNRLLRWLRAGTGDRVVRWSPVPVLVLRGDPRTAATPDDGAEESSTRRPARRGSAAAGRRRSRRAGARRRARAGQSLELTPPRSW